MRHAILSRLRTHLQEHYSINFSEALAIDDGASLHHLDALLAFKSDTCLDELRSAIERLEEGTFGICLSCKQEIPDTLMEGDPTRRMCDRCEREYSHVTARYERLPVTA